MRRLFYALGAVFLAIISLAGDGVGVLAYRGNALDKEAKAFVDAAVPVIAVAVASSPPSGAVKSVEPTGYQGTSAGRTSVRVKSLPLKSSGRSVAFASA
jgi:hypothetical protein